MLRCVASLSENETWTFIIWIEGQDASVFKYDSHLMLSSMALTNTGQLCHNVQWRTWEISRDIFHRTFSYNYKTSHID